jgi:single-strand DNA-binding protein
MSGAVNEFFVEGHLGRDPDKKDLETGKTMVKFSIANDQSYKPTNGEKVERTYWFNIVAFDSVGDFCYSYLKKGSRVFIQGQIEQRKYIGKDGTEKTDQSIKARVVRLLDKAPKREETDGGNLAQPDNASGRAEVTITDDDLPF